MSNNLYRHYRTRKFADIFPTVDDFVDYYENCGIPHRIDDSIEVLYYLLLAQYSNSAIASSDENRFKLKMMSIIFTYGPYWAKQDSIMQQIMELNIEDVINGNTVIHNIALNPATEPGTQDTTEIPTINQQNVDKYRKGVLEGYNSLLSLLTNNYTEVFIAKFRDLFTYFPAPNSTLYWDEEDNEDGNIDDYT